MGAGFYDEVERRIGAGDTSIRQLIRQPPVEGGAGRDGVTIRSRRFGLLIRQFGRETSRLPLIRGQEIDQDSRQPGPENRPFKVWICICPPAREPLLKGTQTPGKRPQEDATSETRMNRRTRDQ